MFEHLWNPTSTIYGYVKATRYKCAQAHTRNAKQLIWKWNEPKKRRRRWSWLKYTSIRWGNITKTKTINEKKKKTQKSKKEKRGAKKKSSFFFVESLTRPIKNFPSYANTNTIHGSKNCSISKVYIVPYGVQLSQSEWKEQT